MPQGKNKLNLHCYNMKNSMKHFKPFAAILSLLLVSCVNDNISDPIVVDQIQVKSLSAQIEAMEASLDEVTAILASVEDEHLAEVAVSMAEHIAALGSGISVEEGTLSTLRLQKELAHAAATLSAGTIQENVAAKLKSLEKGAATWIGDHFTCYYPLALVEAEYLIAAEEISSFQSDVEGIRSDVVSGLRTGVEVDELESLSVSFGADADSSLEMGAVLGDLLEEVESEYVKVIHKVISQEDYDVKALKAINKSAAATVSQAQESYADLLVKIAECESAVADLEDRLSGVEADVDALLGMIQSLTFVSEYSEDYACAYYELKDTKIEDQSSPYFGLCNREPVGTFDLNYMVRPASAAAALVEAVAGGTGTVGIIGYYAENITRSSASVPDFIDFDIQQLKVVNESQGLVSVTVGHDLSQDFYFRSSGVRCALSVVSGKTDIVSKFVELRPKENGSEVHVESISLSQQELVIDNGESKALYVTITPSNATDKDCMWSSADPNIAIVDPRTGVITAVGVGETTVTVTTNGTDEWGLSLSASCKVKVVESVRLSGAPYVEVGKTSELILDYPTSMIVESREWWSSDNTKATVDQRGVVTALADTYGQASKEYLDITISCKINGSIVVSHAMKVVVAQPKSICISSLADDQNQVVLKVDDKLSLEATIYPENVDDSKFRMMYQSDQGLGWIDSSTGMVNEYSKVMNPGTAWVYIDVLNRDDHHYLAPGVSLRRTLAVNVEPYWVKNISFPSQTVSLEPGQSTKLTPVFKSDVDGVQPTYTDLVWTSSNPDCVSIDPKTGELVTLAEGSAKITATTCHDWSVPEGSGHMSASCDVIVEKPTAAVNVGDYYYSDGTWSTSRDYSKTVIGIVFAKASPATADKVMMADYPKCTHGLVVALKEYQSAFGQFGYMAVYPWLSNNGYEVPDTSKPNGYGLTKGLSAYRVANPTYCELFDSASGPAALQNAAVKSPASSWYVPSYYEMRMLWEQKSVVNGSLAAVSADRVSDSYYWSSTLRTYNSYNDCQGSPFDMATGGWYAFDKKAESYPVRVVLAF